MIYVIGTGPGTAEWVAPAIKQTVARCDVLVGSERLQVLFPEFSRERHLLSSNLGQTYNRIADLLAQSLTIGVLVSGDPGFYSILSGLKREFPAAEIAVLPGISSLQLAFAKAGLPWQEASFCSVHGRDLNTLPRVISSPLAVLTGGANTPQKVAQLLLDRGQDPEIAVGNALGYADEVWELTRASALAVSEQALDNAILIIFPTGDLERNQQERASRQFFMGISDDEFIRDHVPMTKAEVRVQVLAKAHISLADSVVDVGAGTGSISIEAALLAQRGMVYAVENNSTAQELIQRNCEHFQVSNVVLVPESAPEAFTQIPAVNVCIIGGSKGHLREIITQVPLIAGGRLVMTAVTLENAAEGLALLQEHNYCEIEAISLQVVRWQEAGDLHMANSLNQVFIISATKGGKA
ncbi:bifunctional cobalt-precorrin-7 (C(5))-methyltransferase/cobalt-precorrin-6B (C(15))-methyltransferase [Paradesulfitobacterium aromaticivorans]